MPAPLVWTPELVVEALRRWAAEHERTPTVADFDAGTPAWCPSRSTAQRACGSWSEALRIAGLPANRTGRPIGQRAAR